MFPRELLAVRRRGARVHPVLAPVDAEHLALAREMIALFAAHEGARRGALQGAVQERELDAGTGFKVVRGLATLLERRCAFELATRVDPATARRVVWEESARLAHGAAAAPDERARVLAAAAERLGESTGDVERALDADLDENLVLVHFDAPEPEWLLKRFNLSLAQTLLFDAVKLEVSISRNARQFLSLVKLQGLMHVVTRDEDGTHHVTIDGPVSLFRDTRRYGTAMAKVVPGLARCAPWSLRAVVHDRESGRERVFESSDDALPMPRDAVEEESFDSATEARFADAWNGLRSPWRLEREPAAIQLPDGELFVPDFGFAWRDGPVTVFLEIVGYWTPAYLARKREKIAKLPPGVRLLLAVDRNLGVGEDAFEGTADAFLYKGDVPVVPVVQWLKRLEDELVAEEASRVTTAGVPEDVDVVTVRALAERSGVTQDAAERALEGMDLGDRVRVGDAFVAPRVLDAIRAKLVPGMSVADVTALAGAHGLTDTASLLDHLGWKVAWRGLDAASAVVTPRDA